MSPAGESSYDAVVVGARCAGSPLAARLAEQGWSVLLVDREPPPADTLSTGWFHASERGGDYVQLPA